MIRTFLNLTIAEPGFEPAHAIAVSVSLPSAQYTQYGSVASYFDLAVNRIGAIPGVESVGAVSYLPLIGYNPGVDFRIPGRGEDETAHRADLQPTSAGYFQAMKIPLLRGQQFTESAMKPSPDSVIINNAFAKKFWPGEEPLGRHIQLHGDLGANTPLVIVGIVGDVKQFGLHTDPRPEIYLPMYRSSMTVIARGSGDLAPAIRDAIERLDGRAAIRISTLEQVVADSIEKRRIFAVMLGTLAVVALLLATLGIHGVISYLVAQRTREIGIRMALGARAQAIQRMVLGEGAKVVAVGTVLGISLAYAATRFLANLLYGVNATDSITFGGVALLLVGAALMACIAPARRAAKVDPIAALRSE
jgi:predicted permease